MEHFFRDFVRYVERMGTQEWLLVFVVALIVGVICMRGFGSRSGY